MYENFHLCNSLNPTEKCFCLIQYNDGLMIEVLHQHVPAHRMSSDAELEALKALINQHSEWDSTQLLHSFLNNRKGGPIKPVSHRLHVTYPEAGVIRRYVTLDCFTAWVDHVINRTAFRSENRECIAESPGTI